MKALLKGCSGCLVLVVLLIGLTAWRWYSLPPCAKFVDPLLARYSQSWDFNVLRPELHPDNLKDAKVMANWASLAQLLHDKVGPVTNLAPVSGTGFYVNLFGSSTCSYTTTAKAVKSGNTLTIYANCIYSGGRWSIGSMNFNGPDINAALATPSPALPSSTP